MRSLKTSALVVTVKGPNSGYGINTISSDSQMSEAVHANEPNSKYGCTWVIERYQYVGRGLLWCSSLTVNDVKGNSLSLSYVIAHAACGVNDKAEHRGVGKAHQPAVHERVRGNLPSPTVHGLFFCQLFLSNI